LASVFHHQACLKSVYKLLIERKSKFDELRTFLNTEMKIIN